MRRSVAGLSAVLVLGYLATLVFGVPAIRRNLGHVQALELREGFRELFPRASGAERTDVDRTLAGLRMEIERVVPIFPGVVMVKHHFWAGRGSPDAPYWRAVLWYVVGLRFLGAPAFKPAPNTALQRTRSAPLRSPLSFKMLGDLR
jgi:hypothetical protein